jgi:hypothetical protein
MLSTSSLEHFGLPHCWVLAGLFHFLLQLQQKNAFAGFFFKQLGQ